MTPDDDARRKAAELRLLQAQIQEGSRQMEAFQSMAEEIRGASLALEHLPSSKKDSLVSLGAGVYGRCPIASDAVLVDIGARVLAEKNVDDARALLKERSEQVERALSSMQAQLDAMISRAQMLSAQLSDQSTMK